MVASVQQGEKRRQLFRISLGPDDKVCVFGKHSSWTEEWAFRRYRRGADGAWVRDHRPGLHLDPAKGELFRDGVLRALHQRGVPAPSLGFTYLAERHEAEAADGDPGALVSHLVLKALGLALGQGDREGLGELGRAALKYIRTQSPGYVAPGDGDGLLDRKGDDSRNTGKDDLLHCATSFCREFGENAEVGKAALDLAWEVERLHPESYRAAMKVEAEAHPELAETPAATRLCDRFALGLETSVRPTPESVARLALKTLGVPKEKVAHYFDYRYAGVDRSKTVTKHLPGRSGHVPAYVAMPAREGLPRAAVVVIPELFAVTDQAQHVARRLAREGFLAIVPHLLHRTLGSTDPTEVPLRLAKAAQALSSEEIEQDLCTLLEYLERQIPSHSVGLLGFEAGAATAHHVACTGRPLVGAAVAFYGITTLADAVPRVPLLALIGDRDPLLDEDRRAQLHAGFERLANGSRLEVMSDAGRGFFDPMRRVRPRTPRPFVPSSDGLGYFDVRVPRYFDRDASDAAWEFTLAFLKHHLRR